MGLFAIVALVGDSSNAHQKWLWPNRFHADQASVWISFDATWSDTPFTAESGLGDQEIQVIGPNGEVAVPKQVFQGKTKTTVEFELTESGTYRLDAIDPLTYWTQVERDGKKTWLRKSRKEVGDAKITRSDLYWSKATAYVTVGKVRDEFSQAIDDPLYLQPGTHPNSIVAGHPLELTVLSKAKPLTSAIVKVFDSESEGHKPLTELTSNDQGVCQFTPSEPGLYLFACEWEREAPGDARADLHSFNVYLTINVLPALP